jgi:hypothetical protein
MRAGLVLLLEDGALVRETALWRGGSGRAVSFGTIAALCERNLLKIIVESRHKRRHTALLTEIGFHVARDIARGRIKAPQKITEAAARFIAVAVS